MLQSLLLSVGWLNSSTSLLAVAIEGEGFGKALAIAIGLTGLALLLTSAVFEELAARVGLPSVLGNLIAGLVIGISGLHILVLEGGEVNTSFISLIHSLTHVDLEVIKEVFDGPVKTIFENYAELGVGILLFTIGLESDLEDLLKVGLQSAMVAIVGFGLPFVLGFFGLTLLFHVATLPALFAGAALTATSIGITAQVMQDMGVLKSKEGQIILGAAIIDDILGIVILAVIISIVETGKIDVGNGISLILIAASFIMLAVLMNQFFGSWFVEQSEKLKSPKSIGRGAFTLLLLMSVIAGSIGLESILGAFAAGLVLSSTKYKEIFIERSSVLVNLLATVFFVSIGSKTDLSILNPSVPANREGLIIAAFLIVVAIIGKVTSGFFAFSEEKVNRIAIGTGMIPRGEVGLVFAGLGAATGVLPPSIDVGIILMVIFTTFLAPPLLRIVFKSSESTVVETPEVS
ncbi:cation:proton antiporter [Cyanothece sp. BG0011]|uniref:cation:proton antiporter n=1 Tax=Cyanothece sp. BG0011 TaxID=2082950 RepID=UPI000D1E0ECD|nr:cation:proton antiporter [Cyanothece sp. BG0011]